MSGPIPKPSALRQRANKASTKAELKGARIRMPKDLPKPRVIEVNGIKEIRDWHPFVVEYWKLIRNSPMVTEYVQADLPRLYMLMDLVDLYWYGKRDLAAEIRLQSQCFGLTPIDRRRLQWEVQRVEAGEKKRPPSAPPSPVTDPRRLLELPELN